MTKEERQFLMNTIIEEYKITPDDKKCLSDLHKKYGVKVETIKKYLSEAGIPIINNRTKSSEKSKIIEIAVIEYINTPEYERSAAAVARKYGLNRKTIIAYAKQRGFIPTQHHNKPVFDNTVFDNIDTEEKAYWLGFMYADGFVTVNNNTVGLTLATKDIEHLKKFNSFLKYPKGCTVHENGTGKNGNTLWCCSTQIKDLHLWESLKDKGCVPNKSLITTFPSEEQVPDYLKLHFLRGYCDGDGSLGIYDGENSLSIIGTKEFVTRAREFLNIHGSIYHKTDKAKEVYVLRYSTAKAYKVAKLLYENSNIHLNRKYNIYLKMCPPKSKDLGNNSSKIGEDCDVNPELTISIAKGDIVV